eukprot:scaffold37267_cov66-Phaeocystis_antarctica.AAC.5
MGIYCIAAAAIAYFFCRIWAVITSIKNATAPVVQPIAAHTSQRCPFWQRRYCADCCCRSCSKIELESMS